MRFWLRELLGMFLMLVGLYFFLIVINVLLQTSTKFLEGIVFMIMGIVVFRGGIHLLKVAVAARIAMRVAERERKPAAKKEASPPAHLDW